MTATFIMHTERLCKSYDKKLIIENLSLSFYYGAKIGVIGMNGSGKSTLLKVMARVEKEFDGTLYQQPGITIGHASQEPILDPLKSVRDELEVAVAGKRSLLERHERVSLRLAEPLDEPAMQKALDELSALQEKIEACNAWELDRELDIAADALELPPLEARCATLSGGEKRRLALCKVLMQAPDLLLLDEPTNHLDAASVAWLERFLKEFKGTVIAVTHDRYFLDNVAEWILELDHGRGIPWKGNYSSWLEQKKSRLELTEKAEEKRQRTLERELEWIRMAPRARTTKPKARILAYERLLDQESDVVSETMELILPPGPRLGNLVVEARGLCKGYGDNLLIDHLDFSLPPGGIIGVIGPTGAGKTTLMKLVAGLEDPDEGRLTIGPTVTVAYVDQTRESLNPDHSVYVEISGGEDSLKCGKRTMNSRAYVSKFGFRGTDQQKPVGALSGGERNRVQLAKLLKAGANLIILDEPTNDLDVDTLRTLEEALLAFAGCAIVVSHDRWFLDRIATHILAFEGEGKVRWFEGNYQQYAERRRLELGEEADRPHRIRYKKLV